MFTEASAGFLAAGGTASLATAANRPGGEPFQGTLTGSRRLKAFGWCAVTTQELLTKKNKLRFTEAAQENNRQCRGLSSLG